MTYPFGSLPGNLIAFAGFLRREHGFRIGSGELHDAARALEIVDLADQRAVQNALRPVLSRTLDDVTVFDRAFSAFFFPVPARAGQRAPTSTRPRLETEAAQHKTPIEADRRASAQADEAWGAEAPGIPFASDAALDSGVPPQGVARATYSPLEAEAAGEAPELTRAEPVWRAAACALVRRLHLGHSRRWRPAARGRRFDLRRTLRASLQTGGEALTAKWLRRPRMRPRFILFIDGSRSMSVYTSAALRIAVALASATMRLEVFTFSTALERVTDDVRRAAAGEVCRLERLHHAWAGGTSIGGCLRDFLQRFGERMVTRDTVVLIVSDGLDTAEPARLGEVMRDLQRRSASLVWLNPLLETPGYEPTAAGMSAARPYITTFASVTDEAGFTRLSRLVRVRR